MSQSIDRIIDELHRKYPTEEYVTRALDRKLRLRAGAKAYSAQSLTAIEERLRSFLSKRIRGAFEVSDLRPLTGGLSKEQFAFVLTRDVDGKRQSERLVLRTQPIQSAAETHRLREYQIMGALQGVVPLPEPRWVDAEGQEFENPALICNFVQGVSKPEEGPTAVQTSYGRYRETLGPQFAEMLARTHAYQCDREALSAFDMPQVGTNEGVITHINWWARVWEEDAVEPEPVVTMAEQWLRAHAPPIDRASLLHGDYRNTNFLFSLETGEITAVLDWELASIGDRHLDLAYVLQPLFIEKMGDGTELVCGLMPADEFLREYQRRSGLNVDPQRLRYYDVFMRWRNVVTTIGGGGCCAVALNTHHDILFAWFVSAIRVPIMAALRESLERVVNH